MPDSVVSSGRRYIAADQRKAPINGNDLRGFVTDRRQAGRSVTRDPRQEPVHPKRHSPALMTPTVHDSPDDALSIPGGGG